MKGKIIKLFYLTTIILMIAITSCFAQVSEPNGLELHLSSGNLGGGQIFYQGQPIGITISLQDKRFFGKADNEEIKQKLDNGELKTETLGNKNWRWYRGIKIQAEKIEELSDDQIKTTPVLENIDWLKNLEFTSSAIDVNDQPIFRSIYSVFKIEPEISQTLEPGKYIIKAQWDSNEPNAPKQGIWQGMLETEPIEITIVIAESNEDKGKLAYLKANDYFRKGDYDSALKEALITEEMFPSYRLSDCYTIIALVYGIKGDEKLSLEYYRKYLNANENANPNRNPYIITVQNRIKSLEESLNNSEVSNTPNDPNLRNEANAPNESNISNNRGER